MTLALILTDLSETFEVDPSKATEEGTPEHNALVDAILSSFAGNLVVRDQYGTLTMIAVKEIDGTTTTEVHLIDRDGAYEIRSFSPDGVCYADNANPVTMAFGEAKDFAAHAAIDLATLDMNAWEHGI